jgi:hypothetical protein
MRRLGIATCTLVMGLAASASANTLLAGPISAGAGRDPRCRVVNLGTKPAKGVQIVIFKTPTAMPGSLYAESPVFELAPLQSYVLGQVDPLETPDNYSCIITFAGSGKLLRGSIAVFQGSDELQSEPAR